MNFDEKIKTTYKDVTEKFEVEIFKKQITTPWKCHRKISKSVEKVRRDRHPTLLGQIAK